MNEHGASPALRQAALTLHAMNSTDRAWLLQALPPQHGAALQPLLDELVELGIPPDAALLPEPCVAGAPPPPAPFAALQNLDKCGVHALSRILAGEPARVAAALLGARAWPWGEELLAALPPALAETAQRPCTGHNAAPAFQYAVLTSLQERLARAPSPASPQKAWRRRVQALLARARP